jgi:hypothetical protein
VLKKGFGTMFKTVSGTATCGGCGAQFPQQDVYGGLYDVEIIDLKAQTIRQIDSGLKRPAQTEQRKQWWQFWK